ncbi:MAG: Maf family nucleotide pyrophosphatase [Desulfovibrio sp.]|jgi:septum formation protein|nr:Maf family nucleotide pyrophosphatase [Desulfovibrio sp.]
MKPLFRLALGLGLVLASTSPRRRRFLEEWGLPFRALRPSGVEPTPARGETPSAYACRAAEAKAQAAAKRATGSLILGADTVVALGADVLGKPRDPAEALNMLTRLSGNAHEVVSAVCLLLPDGGKRVFFDTSRVHFRSWPQAVLAAYALSGEPDDKAGAYAIQGQGAFLAERVEGAFSTVVGLPLAPLAETLLSEGLMSPVVP